MQTAEFCCTMKSERGIRKDANTEVYEWCRAIVIAGVKVKADARMCVVCRGYKTHEEELENGTFVCVIGFRPMGFEPAPPG